MDFPTKVGAHERELHQAGLLLQGSVYRMPIRLSRDLVPAVELARAFCASTSFTRKLRTADAGQSDTGKSAFPHRTPEFALVACDEQRALRVGGSERDHHLHNPMITTVKIISRRVTAKISITLCTFYFEKTLFGRLAD